MMLPTVRVLTMEKQPVVNIARESCDNNMCNLTITNTITIALDFSIISNTHHGTHLTVARTLRIIPATSPFVLRCLTSTPYALKGEGNGGTLAMPKPRCPCIVPLR